MQMAGQHNIDDLDIWPCQEFRGPRHDRRRRMPTARFGLILRRAGGHGHQLCQGTFCDSARVVLPPGAETDEAETDFTHIGIDLSPLGIVGSPSNSKPDSARSGCLEWAIDKVTERWRPRRLQPQRSEEHTS